MELRRPTLEDKEAILEMIAEFDVAKSYMHGGMGSAWKRAKNYEDCLKIVEQQEDAANLPVGWVPAIKFLSFDETGLPLGFLALRLSLNDKLFVEGGSYWLFYPSQSTRQRIWEGAVEIRTSRGSKARIGTSADYLR